MQIIFLGTISQGLHGNGKQFNFIKIAAPILIEYGHSVHITDSLNYITYLDPAVPTLVCMIYNEEGVIDPNVHIYERVIKSYFKDLRVIHGVEQGMIIGNKSKTNQLFEKFAVPVPRTIHALRSDRPVLARWVLGSGLAVRVFAPGEDLETDKINTEYVDTVFNHKGTDYYVCLRSMCFWDEHVSTYLRCRPYSDGNPSVHTSTTPAEPSLLNDLFSLIVTPRLSEISDICQRAGRALGPGFYSHDILPPNDGSPLRICETGFKYDEMFLSKTFSNLSGKLLMSDIFNNVESLRMTYAFHRKLGSILRWTDIEADAVRTSATSL